MRILHVIGSLDRGGAETFLMNVLRNIDRDKFSFVFLCYGDGASDYDDEAIRLGAKIVRIPEFKDVGMLQHIKDVRQVIRDNEIDVVHAHTYYNSVFSLVAARLSGVKLRIAHSHNTVSEANPGLLKKAYFIVSRLGIALFSNKFLACGNEAGRALFLPGSHFTVIYNGIDVRHFSYSESTRKNVRKELGIRGKETVVMHAGRFAVAKNHKFLIAIFGEYCKQNTNAKLLLVGDGPLRSTIEQDIKKRGLSGKVMLLGKRSDMSRLYNAADIFVFPSLFEGLGIVLIEAQAVGLRCIVSDAVPIGAKLTDLLYFKSLSETPEEWSSFIDRHILMEYQRTSNIDKIIAAGYDIRDTVSRIGEIYG